MKFKITGCCIAILLLFSVTAFAQWNWKYQQDLPYTFNGVDFPSKWIGYIVGSSGVIYKTIDAGQTWTQQTSPVAVTLNDVSFSDDTHGFAVGSGGTIIYTTDGTNWYVHSQSGVLTTSTLNTVCMKGSTKGWMGGGTDGSGSAGVCLIYRTVDGGTTWTGPAATTATDICNDISFYDENVGYAACDSRAPSILYTNDGGLNWNASTLNLGPYSYTRTDIECIKAGNDANTAFAGGWGSMVGPQPTIILVSTNGGANFNCPNTSYPWATYAYGNGFGKFDDGEAMLVGGGGGAAAIVVRSNSPYGTWSRYPSFFGYELQDVCAVPTTNAVVAVGSAGCIAYSGDRGATWSFQYRPGTRYQGAEDFADAGKDRVYCSATSSTVLDFDVPGNKVYHRVAAPNGWGPYDMWDIDYVVNPKKAAGGGSLDSTTYDVIYICGSNNYLVKSYDRGLTWKETQHSISNYDALNGMYWLNPDTGFVVGNRQKGGSRRAEVIYKTSNGGVTLDTVLVRKYTGATSYQFNDVNFAPDSRMVGAVVGTNNKIRYTNDGGVNWRVATENITDTTIALQRVIMFDKTRGWACGDKGTLIKTTDGGVTWTTVAGPWGASPTLYSMDWRTPTWGFVAGGVANSSTLCYYTTDGGTSWTNISATAEIPAEEAKAVYYQGNAGILWLGARNSKVLNRTDGVTGTETPKSLPYVLNQNYPNPFNPATMISFALPVDDHVSLNVYDVSGRLVASVLNKDMKAGSYSVGFKADGLASGVYFYVLKTSKYEESRKMILLR